LFIILFLFYFFLLFYFYCLFKKFNFSHNINKSINKTMAQTNLSSDSFCMYNQNSAPFFWVMEPGQYENTYSFGEVGINAAGGTAGSYVRPDVIDISSFLSGRDDMLSKCQPPVPDLEDLTEEKLHFQNSDNSIDLLPQFTREKKSAVDLSAIDYNRWQPLDTDAQDLRFVIEDFSAQRGGLDTQNFTKLSWTPGSFAYKEGACKYNLNPAHACGEYCEPVSGYPGKDWITGKKLTAIAKQPPKPPHENNYPFPGPYSQQVEAVGADTCGENSFYGPRYMEGSCPVVKNDMLEKSALSLSNFPVTVQ
jgi:hypothetical protein